MDAATAPLPEPRLVRAPDAIRVRLDGDRLSYLESGRADSPALIALHGVGANAGHWRFQLAGLSDVRRVVAWNAPGYLLSDPFLADTPTGDDYADALAALMDALGIARADILGNSFGTRVAQAFARRHPGRVRRMVLTGAGAARADTTAEQRAAAIAAREAQMEAGSFAFGDRVAALLGPDADAATAALVQATLRMTHKRGSLQAARFGQAPADGLALARAIAAPTLLIQGDRDRVNPLEVHAEPLSRALPDARLEVLPGIGHLPEVEAPETVNRLVRAFLA